MVNWERRARQTGEMKGEWQTDRKNRQEIKVDGGMGESENGMRLTGKTDRIIIKWTVRCACEV